MMEEFVSSKAMPRQILVRAVNIARVMDLYYKDGDGYSHPDQNLKDLIVSLFLCSIPLWKLMKEWIWEIYKIMNRLKCHSVILNISLLSFLYFTCVENYSCPFHTFWFVYCTFKRNYSILDAYCIWHVFYKKKNKHKIECYVWTKNVDDPKQVDVVNFSNLLDELMSTWKGFIWRNLNILAYGLP